MDVPIPAHMCLPIDELQRRAEEMEYSELLDQVTHRQLSRRHAHLHNTIKVRQLEQSTIGWKRCDGIGSLTPPIAQPDPNAVSGLHIAVLLGFSHLC